MMLKHERYITVVDDWYPCFKENTVRLTLSLNQYKDEYYVKLAAWGADDFGLEIVDDGLTFEQAQNRFYELMPFYEIIPNGISKDWFYFCGFKRF